MSTTATAPLVLVKGEKVDLTKTNPGLVQAFAGLGWDVNAGTSGDFDLDAFAIALKGGKCPGADHILYFHSPKTNNFPTVMGGALVHSGDNLTGAGR